MELLIQDGNNFWCILVVKMVESSERHYPGQKLVVHLVSFDNFENKEIHVVMS